MNGNNELKHPSNTELSNLGISSDSLKLVETLDDLKTSPPNIVIGECQKSVRFTQNQSREQKLDKKVNYVMGLGVYIQLHYDPRVNLKVLKPSKLKFKGVYKPYEGQNLDNKTLLVFRTGGIGDLLFISPNLIHLKKKYPSCKIKFACGPQYQSMVKEWSFIDEVLDLPFNARELIRSDYHVIFEGVIERCKEAETTNAYRLFTKWMNLNLSDESLVPFQEPNLEMLENSRRVIQEMGVLEEDFILVQMRASSPIRTPRPEVWIKLLNLLTSKGHNILLTDLPQNDYKIDEFISKLENKDKVFNFCKYSKTIGDTIALTSLSKLVISVDSALNHIAASLGVKTFGIFGPFPGDLRLSTYPKNLCDWIDVKKDCAPCFQHGTKLCKNSSNGHVTCFDNINYEETIEKIEKLLKVD